MTNNLIRLATECAGNTVRAIADVIDGGIILIFLESLRNPLSKPKYMQPVEWIIDNLVKYTHHRRTATALRKVFDDLPIPIQWKTKGNGLTGDMFWRLRTALARLDEHHLGHGIGGIIRIWDNILVSELFAGLNTRTHSILAFFLKRKCL